MKHIQIEGNPTEESKKEIEKLRGQNILWLSVTRPESEIKQKQPNIKELQILRGIPDTLRVKLVERQPTLIWQVGETWFTLDPYGFIFRKEIIQKNSDNTLVYPGTDLPVVVDTTGLAVGVGQTIIRPEFITFIHGLKDRLPKEFGLKLVRAEVTETTFNVTAVTDAGWNILFDTTRPLDNQLRTLSGVLASKRGEIHQYIDVRVRGWVYYK